MKEDLFTYILIKYQCYINIQLLISRICAKQWFVKMLQGFLFEISTLYYKNVAFLLVWFFLNKKYKTQKHSLEVYFEPV